MPIDARNPYNEHAAVSLFLPLILFKAHKKTRHVSFRNLLGVSLGDLGLPCLVPCLPRFQVASTLTSAGTQGIPASSNTTEKECRALAAYTDDSRQ